MRRLDQFGLWWSTQAHRLRGLGFLRAEGAGRVSLGNICCAYPPWQWQQRLMCRRAHVRLGNTITCYGGRYLRSTQSTCLSSRLERGHMGWCALQRTMKQGTELPSRRSQTHSRTPRTRGGRYVKFGCCAIFSMKILLL